LLKGAKDKEGLLIVTTSKLLRASAIVKLSIVNQKAFVPGVLEVNNLVQA